MATMTKAQEAGRTEAIERLREVLPEGSTVYCILRHWRTGSNRRVIGFFVWRKDEFNPEGRPFHLNHLIAELGLYKHHKEYEGLTVEGGGMDMGFAVVHDLMRALWGSEIWIEQGRTYKLNQKWI